MLLKPFVINRYGHMVFPCNFFPELDFSVFETLNQFNTCHQTRLRSESSRRNGYRDSSASGRLQEPLRDLPGFGVEPLLGAALRPDHV
jgi:hypothetical protein